MNTQNRFTWSEASIDQRMAATCNNVKAMGVIAYTALVMAGNAILLQNCAAESSKYFALTSVDRMITAFNTVGTALPKLRIVQ